MVRGELLALMQQLIDADDFLRSDSGRLGYLAVNFSGICPGHGAWSLGRGRSPGTGEFVQW